MFNYRVPIFMVTDSLSLFNVLIMSSITTEKRLMIDLLVVRNAYMTKEIETLVFFGQRTVQ